MHHVLILSTLLYAAETWILLSEDLWVRKAFHRRCLQIIMEIYWHNFITNHEVLRLAAPLAKQLSKCHLTLFSHIARLMKDDIINSFTIMLSCHLVVTLSPPGSISEDGQERDVLTNFKRTTLSLPPLSGDVPFLEDMVQKQHNGPPLAMWTNL